MSQHSPYAPCEPSQAGVLHAGIGGGAGCPSEQTWSRPSASRWPTPVTRSPVSFTGAVGRGLRIKQPQTAALIGGVL